MEINQKYSIDGLNFDFEVIDSLEFTDVPYLLLERDKIGNRYLSYLIESDDESEFRAYVQISESKFKSLVSKSLFIKDVFEEPENNCLIIIKFSLYSGMSLESFLIPSTESQYKFSALNYFLDYDDEEIISEYEIIDYSIKRQKLVFDFYLHSQNLIQSIKPYALYKVFTPLVEIIKNLVGFDNRNADEILAFSNLRHSSLGITIELNYSKDLFLEKENEAMLILIDLLNAEKTEDFESIVGRTKDTKYIKHYKSIIKAIIENNADLNTVFAHPLTHELKRSSLDKEKALKAKAVVEESFDIIEDVEEITGRFLEIDIDAQEPSFKIIPNDDESPLKGKFETSLLEKLKTDLVNLGSEEYLFIIKTLYHPETIVKSEEIKRYMVDYKKKN
ncbi:MULTISPECIES: hypothetical protein [unclassified Flavobacterium]|uniref:hypothetical protein n=1 Tax=unclassified Flavobacterium TaxID=196869 RepID=UPI000BB37B0E|nr:MULTISPECIES: hypothetical protein [unclassified Flavobacterium]MDY0988756.1 hypothetical protein [Flavobacterium sp. CFBP9031]PBJ12236.1 hypothetical protein BSF42_21910 [Flavobacterium sp. ACN6]